MDRRAGLDQEIYQADGQGIWMHQLKMDNFTGPPAVRLLSIVFLPLFHHSMLQS
jgi:hypothetical protein